MREQKITRTIEEVNGYIADDGKWFKEKEECQRYEESAKMVVFKMIQCKRLGGTTIYELIGEGSDDCDVEIYSVDSIETVELLNRYIALSTYDKKADLITTEMVGKEVLLFWDYDREYCYYGKPIEDLFNDIKGRYDTIVNKANKTE